MANVIENRVNTVYTGSAAVNAALHDLHKIHTAAEGASGLGGLGGLTQIAGLGLGVGAIAAVSGAFLGLSEAAKGAVESLREAGKEAEQLSNLSQKTGIATSALEGLQLAFKEAGVAEASLNIGLRFLNRSISEGDPALKKLGIITQDTKEALLELADAFSRSADGPDKTAVAIKVLGRAGSELIPVLNKGRVELETFLEQAEKTGAVLSEDTIKALKDLDNQFDALDRSMKVFKNTLLTLVAPAVVGFVKDISGMVQKMALLPQLFAVSVAGIAVWNDMLGKDKDGVKKLVAEAKELAKQAEVIADLNKKPFEVLDLGGQRDELEDFNAKMRAAATATKEAADKAEEAKKKFRELLETFVANTNATPLELPAIKPTGALEPEKFKTEKPAENIEKQLSPGIAAMAAFKKALIDATDVTLEKVGLLQGAFDGLASGLQEAFLGLLNGVESLGTAIVGVIKSMVSAILSELAKLAAAAIFKLFLKLIGFSLGPAGAVIAVASGFSPSGSGGGLDTTKRSGDVVGQFGVAIQDLSRELARANRNAVLVDRVSFFETIGNALAAPQRRRALAQGW